ncbi:hypothetical protein DFS34DRAFT_388415 [Phlyctochytrium arcticum]|nr:hypothetical protein DFS34DRAFT_388415 [Phlyctochytrium arcticum]
MVAFILMSRFEPSGGYPNRDTVLLLGSLACGIVGGGISLCLWRIGLILLGATAGFLFGMFILSWESGGVIKDGKGRIIFLAVMTALPAIFISFFQKILLVVASSIAGAYSVIFGIDCYAKTGFTDSARNFLVGADKFSFTVFARDGKVIALLCSMIALAIIGMIVQFRIFKRKDKY